MTENEDPDTPDSPLQERAQRAIHGTTRALRVVLTRRDTIAVLVAGIVAYIVLYSYSTGALSFSGSHEFDLQVVADPLARAFQQTGSFSFEPIARVQAFGVSYLFSPIEVALALFLAVLVGVNLAVSYLGIVQPRACGLAPSSGVLAAFPALLSGAACCGPIIFVILGIQATGALLAGVQFLIPVSVFLLVASLLVVGQRIDPTLIDTNV